MLINTTLSTILVILSILIGLTQNIQSQSPPEVVAIQDFYGSTNQELCQNGQSFGNDTQVTEAINKMMMKIGANNRFIIASCDKIDNCQAVFHKEKPYILYNPSFLQAVKRMRFTETPFDKKEDWEALTVLAHEIGHHVNQHVNSASASASPLDLELEADFFAGSMMYRMGATLEQAQQVMHHEMVPDADSYTHPARQRRLDAIANGYKSAQESMLGMDSDGDGVIDIDDLCPTIKGTSANRGCDTTPPKDSDGDGAIDSEDTCSDIKGPLSNDGCPTCKSTSDMKRLAKKLIKDYLTELNTNKTDKATTTLSHKYFDPVRSTIYDDITSLVANQIPVQDYLKKFYNKNLYIEYKIKSISDPIPFEDFSGHRCDVELEIKQTAAGKTKSYNNLVAAVHFDLLSMQTYGNQHIREIAFYEKVGGNSDSEIKFWTNKGDNNLVYREEEELEIYFQSPKPRYIRLVYELATGEQVLLFDNHEITAAEVNKELLYPETFVCAPPFGSETALLYCSDTPFAPLMTEEIDGYVFIKEKVQKLETGTKRGFKKKKKSNKVTLVKQLEIKTKA